MKTREDFELLRKRVEELGQLDTERAIFGANVYGLGHHYRFNPPATESEVASFENHNGVTLPYDYRLFLLVVGDGGAGPGYGVLKLEFALSPEHIREPRLWLATPFPYETEISSPLDDEYDLVFGTTTGTIFLCDHGCGMYDRLVVNGAAKGTVWSDGLATGDSPMSPLNLVFFEWYEKWLNDSFGQLKSLTRPSGIAL